MDMLYIWWAIVVVMLGVLLGSLTIPVAVGQYRLQALARVCQYFAVIATTLVMSYFYHWPTALILSLALVIFIMLLAHVTRVNRMMVGLLRTYQPLLIRFVSRHRIFEYISDKRTLSDKVGVSSRDELITIIRGATFMPIDDRRDIATHIELLDMSVRDYMRPVSELLSIQDDDVIGPLLLHDLHLSGQQTFLVVGKTGVIKGTVKLSQLTESSKQISKVQDIMDRHLVHISASATLAEAVKALVREQAWLAVVSDAKSTSVISLQDLSRALLGKHTA